MRTGANFARGSCRALKWMAVLGVLSVLGSTQAAAQPTIESARYSEDGAAVTVTMSGPVRITGDALLPSVFTIPGTSHAVSAVGNQLQATGAGVETFTLTVAPPLTQAATLAYTQPDPVTDPDGVRLVDPGMGGLPVVNQSSIALLPLVPQFQLVASVALQAAIPANIPLPAAIGGIPPIAYTVTADMVNAMGTPAGNAQPLATAIPGLMFNPTTRVISGTPTAASLGRWLFAYTATDAGNPGNVGTVNFNVDVTAGPAIGGNTAGQVTTIAIDNSTLKTIGGVRRIHTTEGILTNVTVTGRWTNAQLTQLWRGRTLANPPLPAQVNVAVASVLSPATWLSPAETNERPGNAQFGGRDVVLATTTLPITIPLAPTSNPNSTLHAADGTGQISISFPHDIDAESEAFVIIVAPIQGVMVPAVAARTRTIVIEDDDPQGIVLTRTPPAPGAALPVITEGSGAVIFDATADPRREDLPLQVRYFLTDVGATTAVSTRYYTLDNSVGQIPTGSAPGNIDQVVVNIPSPDGDRDDDRLEIRAEVVSFDLASGAFDDIQSDSVVFTVLDVHRLPVLEVTPATGSVMEGGEIVLTVLIDRNPPDTTSSLAGEIRLYSDEAVNIVLSPNAAGTADATDYTITPNPVSFAARTRTGAMRQSMTVTIEALDDDEDVGDIGEETLVLDFEVAPTAATNAPLSETEMYPGASSLTISDETMPMVSVKDGAYAKIMEALGADPLNPGDTVEIMTADLFTYNAAAVNVTFGATQEGTAVYTMADDDMVTVNAVSAGDAKVTVKATATATASPLVITQTVSNVAELTFPVVVELADLAITLSAEDMNVVEGMDHPNGTKAAAMITATANRPVEMDTMVELIQTGGTAAPADYMVEPIMIASGEMTGTTMLMAEEDNMAEDMEMLTLEGRAGALKTTNSVSFHLWDHAVPALPLIAQLLLAAFLAIGGYRRYLRR